MPRILRSGTAAQLGKRREQIDMVDQFGTAGPRPRNTADAATATAQVVRTDPLWGMLHQIISTAFAE